MAEPHDNERLPNHDQALAEHLKRSAEFKQQFVDQLIQLHLEHDNVGCGVNHFRSALYYINATIDHNDNLAWVLKQHDNHHADHIDNGPGYPTIHQPPGEVG